MDFEKAMQDDLNDVAKKVEAGLKKVEIRDALTAEEVEKIVRSVVEEELAVAVEDMKKYIKTVIVESQKVTDSASSNQKIYTSNAIRPNIECSQKVSYDVKSEARYGSGMSCAGWTFFANRKEGNHLWAVNDKGTEYYELYPKTIHMVTKIEDGYVYFFDPSAHEFRVSISDGKIEKVKGF